MAFMNTFFDFTDFFDFSMNKFVQFPISLRQLDLKLFARTLKS